MLSQNTFQAPLLDAQFEKDELLTLTLSLVLGSCLLTPCLKLLELPIACVVLDASPMNRPAAQIPPQSARRNGAQSSQAVQSRHGRHIGVYWPSMRI
jgi:hypothetical protein